MPNDLSPRPVRSFASRFLTQRVPLAWRSLVHDRRRLLASVVGIAFAVVLMFLELGFLLAIYDSTTLPVDQLNAELLLVSSLKDDINPSKPFARARLAQARAVDGVIDTYPLYLSRRGIWKKNASTVQDIVRVWAFDPDDPVFQIPGFEAQRHLLKKLDTALVDQKLRESYGGLGPGAHGSLDGRTLDLVGGVELGPDLQLNANLFVSQRTFANVFTQAAGADLQSADIPSPGILGKVEIGLLRIAPEADLETVRGELIERLESDVHVLTPDELALRIRWFWTRNQPVGAVFGVGLVVGFIIGVMICYQIFFTDVADQLSQYATLKAIGYPPSYLVGVALRRGVYLALLSMVLALPLAAFGYLLLEHITGLLFVLNPLRIAVIVVLTLVMCLISSRLAIRKALDADPAELF